MYIGYTILHPASPSFSIVNLHGLNPKSTEVPI